MTPYWLTYKQKQSLQECNDEKRLEEHQQRLKEIRYNQQVSNSTAAREAKILNEQKRVEELRRKHDALNSNNKNERKLGGNGSLELSQVRDAQQDELNANNSLQSSNISTVSVDGDNEGALHRKKLHNQNVNKSNSDKLVDDSLSDEEDVRKIHPNWRDLRSKQDKEYEESLLKDKAKESEKIKREERIKIAMQKLQAEPNISDPGTATIAFKCPRNCVKSRLLRRFQKTAKVSQLFYFLSTIRELDYIQKKQLKLWFSGECVDLTLSDDGNKSLEEIGLFPRGMVIVVDENM